jgi:hypothetical protein
VLFSFFHSCNTSSTFCLPYIPQPRIQTLSIPGRYRCFNKNVCTSSSCVYVPLYSMILTTHFPIVCLCVKSIVITKQRWFNKVSTCTCVVELPQGHKVIRPTIPSLEVPTFPVIGSREAWRITKTSRVRHVVLTEQCNEPCFVLIVFWRCRSAA